MTEASDQFEAAIEALHGLLVMAVETPGAISGRAELRDWLHLSAGNRENNGDFGAARILDRLARGE
ncbi:hypothetical protein [Paracoccus alkanivorans]|uniref:Uncharacterized protein n=1 Tax=Paracoccus alkanivorans TaxID=2116655 RepID=A0A3M0M1E6_9RHOB|nr:hypothetical protein [Paracoccus alkanivorans]RMC30204.1 hypothetical protein C9E81_21950 [Paracoccus alkanivorans]